MHALKRRKQQEGDDGHGGSSSRGHSRHSSAGISRASSLAHSHTFHSNGGLEDSGSDKETAEEYKEGGYHPVKIGEKYKDGRYVVLRKLGWGHFSTVWLVLDFETDTYGAMKVQKSASHYTDAARDEIVLCSQIKAGDTSGDLHCVQLLDSFEHSGPHGLHVCMVFEVLGDNMLSLIRRYKYRGIPIPIVKNLAKQMLLGLDYMHSKLKIIHTDLKPENVMLVDPLKERIWELPRISISAPQADTAPSGPSGMEDDCTAQPSSGTPSGKTAHHQRRPSEHQTEHGGQYLSEAPIIVKHPGLTSADLLVCKCKIVDFGNACWTDKQFTSDVQTRQYRSPEVILGAKYSTPCDMWSLACMVFEMVTGDLLFDPKTNSGYDRNEDHLALVIELLGHMPRGMYDRGKFARDYFNRNGELRHIKSLRFWPLKDVLYSKYKLSADEAESLSSFLLPMLRHEPERRATAAEMLKHPWLQLPEQPQTNRSRTTSAPGSRRATRHPPSEASVEPPVQPRAQSTRAKDSQQCQDHVTPRKHNLAGQEAMHELAQGLEYTRANATNGCASGKDQQEASVARRGPGYDDVLMLPSPAASRPFSCAAPLGESPRGLNGPSSGVYRTQSSDSHVRTDRRGSLGDICEAGSSLGPPTDASRFLLPTRHSDRMGKDRDVVVVLARGQGSKRRSSGFAESDEEYPEGPSPQSRSKVSSSPSARHDASRSDRHARSSREPVLQQIDEGRMYMPTLESRQYTPSPAPAQAVKLVEAAMIATTLDSRDPSSTKTI